ncbi:MAG: hypothetical protein IIC00_15355 [Planctomycetes bacterium]|nr:hypothetical protein [Planctomycetota bacterium]
MVIDYFVDCRVEDWIPHFFGGLSVSLRQAQGRRADDDKTTSNKFWGKKTLAVPGFVF